MRDLGLRVAVRDFEREVWQRSLDNSGGPSLRAGPVRPVSLKIDL